MSRTGAPPQPQPSTRDVYANLLRDTRGLRREQAGAREAWYAGLSWERKEETLFELEMLLKGIACFGNPRNHPGPPRRTPAVAHDFAEELRIVRDTVDRVVTLLRALLGAKDRAFTFTRYLETVLPEDVDRSRLVKDQLAQDTPEEALFALRNALSAHLEICDGMLRLGRTPYRLYHAIHATIAREVGRNSYFNPLVTLEFRPEFDRIRIPEVLEAMHAIDSESAHRTVALSFLALFRALRYVQIIDEYATDPVAARRAYVILAVLRSDLRAISAFLGRRAADAIADGFERELLAAGARDIRERHQEWSRRAGVLLATRAALETTAATMRIEVRKTYERDLPPPDAAVSGAELGPQLVVVTAALRATIQHAIAALCQELKPDVQPPELATDTGARRAASERLRREVWMFSQILRAFLAKASAAQEAPDKWSGAQSFQYVREFVQHFRAIGYQLVRHSDYERLDAFLAALAELREIDLLDPKQMARVVGECRAFYAYLEQLFHRVGQRSELADVPFDKRAAADTLKIYLGAA